MLYYIYQFWQSAFDAENAANAEGWAHAFSFLNLLQYITFRAAVAAMLAFGLSVAFGPWVIRRLISLKIGQPVRKADGKGVNAPEHEHKAGTPTMGGVLIVGSVLTTTLLCSRFLNPFVAVVACTMGALALLGFVDDYAKVAKKNTDGVSARGKLLWQLVVAALAASFIYFKPEISGYGAAEAVEGVRQMGFSLDGSPLKISEIAFPLSKEPLFDLGFLSILFFVAIIIGSSNAVNLTDGLDGLAIGCTISATLAFSVIAYLAGHYALAEDYLFIPFNPVAGELAVFLMALVGAGFGFLWFNCHPAKMFMGDTGSLAIGGAIGTTAICTKQELLLVLVGGIFVIEALSVIIQVGYFKVSGGKRFFRMAPIHHHFEKKGWHENQVIIRFWIISIFMALAGLAILKIV